MKFIDVTLRENVYFEKNIPMNVAITITEKLSSAGIEYIEIGYLGNKNINSLYNSSYNNRYINRVYSAIKQKSKIAAMIHPNDYCPKKWDKNVLKKISLIRLCVDQENITTLKHIIHYFHKLGIDVSLNLTHISKYSVDQCVKILEIAIKNKADYFYIADSNGYLLPEDVKIYIQALVKKAKPETIQIGFHAHDNLSLASINTLCAIENGADIVDSSISGLGKGIGNLKTETFLLLLLRKKIIAKPKYKLKRLFDLAKYVNQYIERKCNFKEEYKYLLYGINNIGINEMKVINQISSAYNKDEVDCIFSYIYRYKCNLLEFINSFQIKSIKNDK